ncbi:uracil-DNA glycosylase [Paenibacillus aurantius]|uniref:Uracil-DNA glycosylase n=1 Tax=Paenibacillus aurantius TaxID=2918900 RepID=A0AA96LD87_9BACL|nr:uracil-DNA glycosylase [Paenibacillus aurantius]WNQ10923.1 uracil-DNA glycosylase [Paenibacillus aurantius]
MKPFQSCAWPEDPVPPPFAGCRRCELAGHGGRMIWGEGNPGASVLVLLDNPGAREDKEGEAFVCGTRETLQEAAHRVGLGPDELYVTYLLKRRPARAYNKEAARQACRLHLEHQLAVPGRRYVLCLGNVSVQEFFRNPEAEVKALRGSWHTVDGLETLVSYHPLAVRRRPVLRRLFDEDWERLAARLAERE